MVNNDTMDLGMGGETGLENTTWWKPDGSDHFTVREMLMSPEGFSVRTTDGRLLPADVMEKYIQSEVPITGHEREQTAHIDPKQLEGIDKSAIVDDNPGGFGSLKYSHPGAKFTQPSRQQMVRKNVDPLNDPLVPGGQDNPEELDAVSYSIIDRVIGNVNFDDRLIDIHISTSANTKFDNWVIALVNTLNIKRSEIKTYMINRIAEKFESMVDTALTKYLDNLLGLEDDEKLDEMPEDDEKLDEMPGE